MGSGHREDHGLFVYGTLRPAQRNHGVIADTVAQVHRASLPGQLYAVTDRYPGLLETKSPGTVVGELFELLPADDQHAALWSRLDRFEGPDYGRVLRDVTLTPSGQRRAAWCYVLQRPEMADAAPHIEHGDWARWLREWPGPGPE